MRIDQSELKITFGSIIDGFSFISDSKFGPFYIKHLTTIDTCSIDKKYKEYYSEAINKKLITEKEQLDYLYKEKLWTKEEDTEIKDNRQFLDGLKLTKTKLFLKNDLDELDRQIKETEIKLFNLITKKNELMGLTAEGYTDKKLSEFYIFFSLYKNINDKIKLFEWDNFDDLDYEEMTYLTQTYNETIIRFGEKNIKRIALCPFFLNIFFLSDNDPYKFYGLPILKLTNYQLELFSQGAHYKNILSEHKNIEISEYLEDPDKLDEYINRAKAVNETLQKSSGKKGTKYIAGATGEDMERLGIINESPDLERLVGKDFNTMVQEGLIK